MNFQLAKEYAWPNFNEPTWTARRPSGSRENFIRKRAFVVRTFDPIYSSYSTMVRSRRNSMFYEPAETIRLFEKFLSFYEEIIDALTFRLAFRGHFGFTFVRKCSVVKNTFAKERHFSDNLILGYLEIFKKYFQRTHVWLPELKTTIFKTVGYTKSYGIDEGASDLLGTRNETEQDCRILY